MSSASQLAAGSVQRSVGTFRPLGRNCSSLCEENLLTKKLFWVVIFFSPFSVASSSYSDCDAVDVCVCACVWARGGDGGGVNECLNQMISSLISSAAISTNRSVAAAVCLCEKQR